MSYFACVAYVDVWRNVILFDYVSDSISRHLWMCSDLIFTHEILCRFLLMIIVLIDLLFCMWNLHVMYEKSFEIVALTFMDIHEVCINSNFTWFIIRMCGISLSILFTFEILWGIDKQRTNSCLSQLIFSYNRRMLWTKLFLRDYPVSWRWDVVHSKYIYCTDLHLFTIQ